MGLEDRDWYREELQRRAAARSEWPRTARIEWPRTEHGEWRRTARGRWRAALKVTISVVFIAKGIIVLPIAVTPRCELNAWASAPVACWQASWAALLDRIGGNMAATRGYPVAIVQIGENSPTQPQTLPKVIRPGQR